MAVRLSCEVYQRIIDTFRSLGWIHASFAEVYRASGVRWQIVSKAWNEGLAASCGGGAPPIKQIAEEELRTGITYRVPGLTRASIASTALPASIAPISSSTLPASILVPAVPRASESPITPEDICLHAQDALRQELRAIATVRDGAIGAAVSARRMLAALQGRIDRMTQEIADQDARGVPVDAVELSKMLHRILVVSQKASEITKQVIEAERLALGSPTEIIKLTEVKTQQDDDGGDARVDRVMAFLAARRKEHASDPKLLTRLEEEDIGDDASEELDSALTGTAAALGEIDAVDDEDNGAE